MLRFGWFQINGRGSIIRGTNPNRPKPVVRRSQRVDCIKCEKLAACGEEIGKSGFADEAAFRCS